MSQVHYYKTNVEWTEGRKGNLKEPTMPTIEVATPPEFPKGVPNTWSPEHLFVASAEICLMTTFLSIAENSNLNFKSYSSEAEGKLEKVDGKFMISEIVIRPKIVLEAGKDIDRAKRIIEKSEKNCLISNSLKTEVKLEPEITT